LQKKRKKIKKVNEEKKGTKNENYKNVRFEE